MKSILDHSTNLTNFYHMLIKNLKFSPSVSAALGGFLDSIY